MTQLVPFHSPSPVDASIATIGLSKVKLTFRHGWRRSAVPCSHQARRQRTCLALAPAGSCWCDLKNAMINDASPSCPGASHTVEPDLSTCTSVPTSADLSKGLVNRDSQVWSADIPDADSVGSRIVL